MAIKLKLDTIDFNFSEGFTCYTVRFTPGMVRSRHYQKDVPGYRVMVIKNDIAIATYETTAFANKSNAKDFILNAVQK